MASVTYWASFALLAIYFVIMVRCWKVTRRQQYRDRLQQRLAPYRGGYFPRSITQVVSESTSSDWQILRDMTPEDALPVIRRLERAYYEAHYTARIHETVHPFEADNVVELNPGYSVKV